MNTHLKQFLVKYLSVVFGTLMSVSFFAFVAIPYSFGGHPGEAKVAQTTLQAPAKSHSEVAHT